MRLENRFRTYGMALLVMLVTAGSLEATTICYVKQNATGDGTSWSNARGSLQDALEATPAYDEIWVAQGTYITNFTDATPPEPDENAKFALNNHQKVYGGFSGTPGTEEVFTERDPVARPTVLSGLLQAQPEVRSKTIVYATNVDSETELDGFTITGATEHAIQNGFSTSGCDAGASPTFRNLIIENNNSSAVGGGAGMHNYCDSHPLLVNCIFQNNSTTRNGGAVSNQQQSNPVFRNCQFINNAGINSGSRGGAIMDDDGSHSTCTNCVFSGNTALWFGGAISHSASNNGELSLILRHCTFDTNESASGGALDVSCETGKPIEIAHCSFTNNTATGSTGGAINIGKPWMLPSTSILIVSCTFENCKADYSYSGAINAKGFMSVVNSVFDGNQASLQGGAIYVVSGSSATIVNCTFSGNASDATNGGGGLFKDGTADCTIQNSIFWNNTANGSATQAGQMVLPGDYTLSHTCIQNLIPPPNGLIGAGLISDNPMFLGGGGDDALSLSAGSPCIDRGLVELVSPDTLDVDEDGSFAERTPDVLLNRRVQDVPNVGGTVNMVVDLGAFELEQEFDCDGDGLPDDWGHDCNENGVPDTCDLDREDPDGNGEFSMDCNDNVVPDECDVDPTDPDGDGSVSPDCNTNGIPDECDINTEDPDENEEISEDCNDNDVPDECDVENACAFEIMFLVDTSGSMDDNEGSYCQYLASPVVDALESQGLFVRKSYISIDNDPPTYWPSFGTCIYQDTTLLQILGTGDPLVIDVPGAEGTSCSVIQEDQTATESWGPGVAVVSDRWEELQGTEPSSPHTKRIIIVLADEGACLGEDCNPMSDSDADVMAARNAIDRAIENDVSVYFIGGKLTEYYWCISETGRMLAEETGGQSWNYDDLENYVDEPEPAVLSRIASLLIDAIVPLDGCMDCNDNGVVDECECTRGNMTDTDAPELVNGYDIQDFVTCLLIGDPSPDGCYCADMNDDLALDMDDVPCFVELLIDGETDCTLNPCLWEDEGEGQAEAMMASPDCNENGRTDSHDLILGISEDANGNGIPDECDISAATSADINTNGVPDESEPDLNANGVPDDVDIGSATSADLNSNGIPDEAEDCNGNGYPDEWEIAQSITADCNNNGTPDDCDDDCNANGVPDDCEIDPTDPDGDGLVSPDCNGNGFPDACDFDWLLMFSLDCNENGIPDECDVASGTSQDCNNNGFPDECDIAAGISTDADTNGVPDECESPAPLGGGVPLAAEGYAFPLSGGFAAPLDEAEAWIEFYTWHWSQQWGSASPLTGAEQFSLMVNKLQELGLAVDASSL